MESPDRVSPATNQVKMTGSVELTLPFYSFYVVRMKTD